jgi:hypothetical protein
LYTNGYLYAPRMYDRNDTSRYVDPASTSYMNRIRSYYNGGMPTYAYDVATKKYVDANAGSFDIEVFRDNIEAGAYSPTVESHCDSKYSTASRECHFGAGMDREGTEYIYCWCWPR